MALLTRAVGAARRILGLRQKQAVPGFVLPLGGGVIPASWPINYYQCGLDPLPHGSSAVVYACRQAYAQTISMCPGTHWQSDGNGGRDRVTTSALSRILKKPNSYQSPADFFLYLTDCLYGQGASFGLATRNARFEIDAIHLMDPSNCSVSVDALGALHYQLAGNPIAERIFSREQLQQVPARDVLHLRFPDPRNPLQGIAPLQASLLEEAASNAVLAHNLAYLQNQGRPSGVIQTDISYHDNPDAALKLRESWNRQTQGANAGGTPILTDGMKWVPAVVNSRDAQLAEFLQISDQRIATAFRVPLPMLSLQNSAGPQGSTESMMGFWVSTGLGSGANLIEDGFGRLFQLAGWPDDYLELDLEALLRANFRDRIEGLARGVQGGIFSPNEARAKEDLPAMPFGDEPRVQQQIVPLSAWDRVPEPTPRPDAPPAAPPAGADDTGEDDADTERALVAYRTRRRLAA